MAAAMGASVLAGCGQKGTRTALVVNDQEINLGTAAFFLRYQQAESAQMMQSYGLSSGTGIWDQEYQAATSTSEAMTYGESLKNSAKDMLVESVVLSQHADDYNVNVPDDLKTSIDTTAEETYSANKDVMDAMGTTVDDIKTVLELSTIQRLIFYPMTEDADTDVSDDEAAQSTITYARTALTKYDSDAGESKPVSDEDKERLKSEMESLLLQVQESGDTASADMKTMASNLDNQDIACTTYSYDKNDPTSDSLMPEDVMNAALTLSDGEIYDGVIDTGDYYYLVRMDKTFDEEATQNKKESIVDDRRQADYQDKLDKWVDESTVTEKKPWKDLKVDSSHEYMAVTNTDGVVSSSDYTYVDSYSTADSSSSGESVSGS